MNFNYRGINLNEFYLHKMVIERNDVNDNWPRVYKKESNVIQSQDLHQYKFHQFIYQLLCLTFSYSLKFNIF